MRRPRVAVGPNEVSGVCAAIGAALRTRGVDVEVVLWAPHPAGFPADRVLSRAQRIRYGLTLPFRRDIVHYQFGATWIPYALDARLARLCRKTMLVSYYGDDCRQYAIAQQLFPARGRVGDPTGDEEVRARVARLARICPTAVVSDLELVEYLRPFYERIYVAPMPLHPRTAAAVSAGASSGVVVVHAASDPRIKGTDEIRAAVDRVATRVPVELRVLTGLPNSAVADALAQADVAIDQLNSATIGVFALEAMRAGLPVLSEYERAAISPFQSEFPVVRVTPESLDDELERVARDRALRAELAQRGRDYVARFHGAEALGEALLALYAHASRPAPRGVYEAIAAGIRRLS